MSFTHKNIVFRFYVGKVFFAPENGGWDGAPLFTFLYDPTQMVTKTVRISMRIVMSYKMKRDLLFYVWRKVNQTETRRRSKFFYAGKVIAEQILTSEEINK